MGEPALRGGGAPVSLVLVAEDEPAVLEVLSEVVEDLGHQVVRAHDGREALMLARAEAPNLVVTDHMMPRLSGVELCRELRNDDQLKNVPVLLLSAAAPTDCTEARAFLPKPFDLEDFERLIKEMLEGTEAATPVSAERAREAGATDSHAEELMNWVAHEVKTPLGAARLNLQILERNLASGGKEVTRYLRSIERQLEGVERLVNSLLDASRLAEGRFSLIPVKLDVKRYLEALVIEWRESWPDVRFHIEVPEEAVELKCDPDRLRQVMVNLASNAVKYGGPAREVRVALELSPAVATIRVSDRGPGIPAADQRRLFDRFHRGRGGRGHGLGLFIAAEIARLHGGALTVRSAIGEGATFSMTLPRAV